MDTKILSSTIVDTVYQEVCKSLNNLKFEEHNIKSKNIVKDMIEHYVYNLKQENKKLTEQLSYGFNEFDKLLSKHELAEKELNDVRRFVINHILMHPISSDANKDWMKIAEKYRYSERLKISVS